MAYSTDKIRNVLLAGHSGNGKTSFAEALAYVTGGADRLGNVADGNTISDFDPEEIKRKASLNTSIVPVDHEGFHFNFFDAPGLFDFELGIYEGMMAAETVLICVSARSGVDVGAIKASQLAVKQKKSRMFYISKLNVENADFDKTYEALRDQFGAGVCPVVVPVYENGKVAAIADLIDAKAYSYKGGKPTEVPFPEDAVSHYFDNLREAVAGIDDDLMDKYFSDEPFTEKEMADGLRKGVPIGEIIPVICGDSVDLTGIGVCLSIIAKSAPAPSEEPCLDTEGKEIVCDANGPLVVRVFKTVADPFVGKLSYVKVISGTLKSGSTLVNSGSGESERMGKLVSVKGKKQTDVDAIVAGDVGAITKLAGAKTGDTYTDGSSKVIIPCIKFPQPTLSLAVLSKNKGDEGKIGSAIQKILDEDPTIKYVINGETGQQVISGLGDQHLEVTLSKIKSKFGVDIGTENPKIAYRETIRATAEAEGKHKKQSGGAGQFGVVQMRFEPLLDGTEYEFVNAVVGGAVPKEFIPAVEKGLKEAMQHGVLAGYPMTGLKATLYDGKYHPVDSKEVAFKSAARLSYKAACAKAKPCLLEPVDNVKIYVPEANTGDVMGNISSRRGRVLGMNPAEDGLQLIEAEVPEAELQDYTPYLRSVTQGRGYYSAEFVRYDPVPGNLEAKIIEEAKFVDEDDD